MADIAVRYAKGDELEFEEYVADNLDVESSTEAIDFYIKTLKQDKVGDSVLLKFLKDIGKKYPEDYNMWKKRNNQI